MRQTQGQPLPLGVTIINDSINFSIAAPKGKPCQLLLYKKGETIPAKAIDMDEKKAVGEVRFYAAKGMDISNYEYNYLIDGKVVVDPYVKSLTGKTTWNKSGDVDKHEVRGILYEDTYDWDGDRPLQIPYYKGIAYSLHVRGFTKHNSSKVTNKGTFAGIIEKIPYMQELGINQIHCMPVYEFEESVKYTNYWGYGPAFFFAPKSAYAASGNGVTEFKDMVKSCHKAGIEVILEMAFTKEMPRQMMETCLRHYMMEYHVDGFIVNPDVAPMESIYADPILKSTKIMRHQTDFQNVMRRFLKGDEGMVGEVIHQLRRHSEESGTYNYITNHNGFTINDLVSYERKHNELNGENNQDGADYNYSWNCGAEGITRKKGVLALRAGQMRNAFFLLLLAQGVPCILAGDEFANTQKGNNNAYCQDNATGWLDWSKLGKEENLWKFVKRLIEIRKTHPVFCQKKELLGMDRISCGIPDVSYHGESAWQTPSEVSSRQLGVYYSGTEEQDNEYFVAYNMHWLEHSFALPSLQKGKKWYLIAITESGILKEGTPVEHQREVMLKERTIAIFEGR